MPKEKEFILKKFRELISCYFAKEREKKFCPGKTKIGVSGPVFDENEVYEVVKTLLSGWITTGPKVRSLEEKFAKNLGMKDAIAVNSGSSANLIALSTLTTKDLPKDERINPGDEVITPAVTWPTTAYPIVQVGAIPVFVDVDPETYCMDPEQVRRAVSRRTKAITLLHMLGHPMDVSPVIEAAEKHGLLVIEDAAEALGAEYKGRPAGSFGELSTFSFFAAHQITTGEGGMIVTNSSVYASIARSLRAFGRACVCPTCKVALDPNYYCPLRHKAEQLGVRGYDKRFVFTNIGYSLKMTELQAAFGLKQLEKLSSFLEQRRRNAHHLLKQLKPYSDFLQLPVEKPWAKHAWFGFAITVKEDAPFTRNEFTRYLERRRIETRPIMAGNIVQQPSMKNVHYKRVGELPVSKSVMERSFYIGCFPGIGEREREYQVKVITDFLDKHKTS